MPRLARLDAPGVLHHVMGRGIEKRKIFLNDEDREDFLSRLAGLAGDKSMKIYAWALLPNHFHLLCKSQKRPLAFSMRKLLTGYVVNFNRRHKHRGHLFPSRYKSIICQEEVYFMELVRYIHLNLLRVGWVRDLQDLNQSPRSGHSALMGNVRREWQDTESILSYFGQERGRKRNYLKFVEEGIPLGRRPELVGGGLRRSLGGGSSVWGLRKRWGKQVADGRILGDGDFVQQFLSKMDDLGKENLRVPLAQKDLSSLAEKVCQFHKVTLGELRSGSRRHEVVEARGELSRVAVQLFGYSGAEVARYLRVTNSYVSRMLSSKEMLPNLRARYARNRRL